MREDTVETLCESYKSFSSTYTYIHKKNKLHRGHKHSLVSVIKKGYLTLRATCLLTAFSSAAPPGTPFSQPGSRESQKRARRTNGRQSTVGARRGTTCTRGLRYFSLTRSDISNIFFFTFVLCQLLTHTSVIYSSLWSKKRRNTPQVTKYV